MDFNEPKLCQGKDVFERMNYLYQASRLVSKSSKVAASYYGNLMIGCAKKSVLRMEPDVKRTMCKNCQSPLIPGDTAIVRLVSKPVKAVKWTCVVCKTTRRFPTKKGHKLWIYEAESVVQEFNYTPKINFETCCKLSLSKDNLLKDLSVTKDQSMKSMEEKKQEPVETNKS